MNSTPGNNEYNDAITTDDPRLTAYVRDELDEAQRRLVEDAMERDAALRAEVESLRDTADALGAALAAVDAPTLTDAQRAAIDRAAAPRRPRIITMPRLAVGGSLAAAAVLAVAFLRDPFADKTVEVAAVQPVPAPTAAPAEAIPTPPDMRFRSPAPESIVTLGDAYMMAKARGGASPRPSARVVSGRSGGEVMANIQDLTERMTRREGEFFNAPEFDLEDALDGPDFNRENYARINDNAFQIVRDAPLSTFSIDVDTASYSNVRRMIRDGMLPPPDAVRIEELVNYFTYDYDVPSEADEHPFSTNVEMSACPWNAEHRLARIGLKGIEIDPGMRPATNLVFLLDVSGSMNDPRKLPLLKRSMRLLLDHLTPDDRVSIVVYAGASGLVLPPTYCHERETIIEALDNLQAGGSTNGGAGIELAYKVAQESFIEGGANRVILCTDGDFNVGASSDGDLVRLIEEKRETGVFLSVLGFGTGNWQDSKMEQLSNHGNGTFAYIDSIAEARKVLVEEMGGTLVTIAKDVKIQVEFNPAVVGAYRLIGYENRMLAARDFNDDTKDAGEIGAGHTVTALYEIVPAGLEGERGVDDLKYQPAEPATPPADAGGEAMTVKLRYKQPDGDTSTLLDVPVVDPGTGLDAASEDYRLAAAIASFGMILRDSPHRGDATMESVLDLAAIDPGDDERRVRQLEEFVRIVELAKLLKD